MVVAKSRTAIALHASLVMIKLPEQRSTSLFSLSKTALLMPTEDRDGMPSQSRAFSPVGRAGARHPGARGCNLYIPNLGQIFNPDSPAAAFECKGPHRQSPQGVRVLAHPVHTRRARRLLECRKLSPPCSGYALPVPAMKKAAWRARSSSRWIILVPSIGTSTTL